MDLKTVQEQSRWLLKHARNITSQCGEDGIISKALDILPERNRWCIEFGAWDGRRFSNTHELVKSRGYRGVYIEGHRERFEQLKKTYETGQHILLNAYVGFGEHDSLDTLLQDSHVPYDVDVLSIDIDGNDYHVWEAVHTYAPKLAIIEYNHTANNSVAFVQEKNSRVNQGSSAASLFELGSQKGYELIAATFLNPLFARKEYYPLYQIPDNSLVIMRDDSHCPQIFSGYDGHVFLAQDGSTGFITLPWHEVKLEEKDVQAIPSHLQKYPDSYNLVERIAWRLRFGRTRC